MSERFAKYGWIAVGLLVIAALVTFPACGPDVIIDYVILRVASTDILTQPWNPVAGTEQACDRFIQMATQDMSVAPDPNSGLYVPWRIDHADVTVQTGLPVGVTPPSDEWLSLDFCDDPIEVPADAWVDWDAEGQEWVTAGEKFAGGETALTRTVVYYPEDIFDVEYHDGSTLSPADFILTAILNFDRAKPESDIYDESYVPAFDYFMYYFKGLTFDFDVPGYGLVVTTYDDRWYLDAEWIVGLSGPGYCWYPVSDYGEYNVETLSLGILAESNNELAFSNAKAIDNEVEWMSYVGGPSLAVLSDYLDDVLDSGNANYQYIPYEPTMGDYITANEAEDQYQKLKDFYDDRGHLWVGTGPYYLNTADISAKAIDLKKFAGYDLPGDMFLDYLNPVPEGPYPVVTGGWLDEITVTIEPDPAAATTELQNNQLDVYAYGIDDAGLFAAVQADSELAYYTNVISLNEFTFNWVKFFIDGRLNPFGVPAVREALNKAIDRDYIAHDILGDLGVPRYTCVGTNSGDATTFAPELANVAATYAYDFDAADAGVEAAMLAVNATRMDGKYYYDGQPVVVSLLIRTEDERFEMGGYLGQQLEGLGFNVTYDYDTAIELAPIWQSDPREGLWNAYTGGWLSTSISRDEGSNFYDFYFLPTWPMPPWDGFEPDPEFLAVATALRTNNFTSLAEREDLFREAIPLSMENSGRIFLVDRTVFQPLRADVAVAADGAGGICGSYIWAATIHFQNDDGVPIAPVT
jgi:hypothetical protein